MIVSVADTHAALWYLFNDPRLSAAAKQRIEDAAANGDKVAVSSISLAEIVYLCEKGRIAAEAFEDILVALRNPFPASRFPTCRTVSWPPPPFTWRFPS